MNHPSSLSEEQIRKVLRGITVPPQPQIIVDIHMEQAMPTPDINHIAKLISQDVGLAGSILKLVNSNLFGRKNHISSIEQAVHIVGLQSIVHIVEGLSIKGEMTDETIVAMGGLWDSAMEIASYCATLARMIGYQSPDKAYCLGLFHNCGVPLLIKSFANYPDIMEEAYGDTDARVIDTENRILKTNHAVVGYYVAKSWHLPRDLCEVIAEHHNARILFNSGAVYAYDGGKKTLLAILKMAEHITGLYDILGRQQQDYEWESIRPWVLEFVGLSEIDFDDIYEDIKMGNTTSAHGSYYDQSAKR
ncbi:Predicted signal transduction protein [gamma proteobacterium HdN1]|nr:Predicted signal transduction protein [gamma proteobacterium HdN1]